MVALIFATLLAASPAGAQPQMLVTRAVNDNAFLSHRWCESLFEISASTIQIDVRTVNQARTLYSANRALHEKDAAWPRFVMNGRGVALRMNRVYQRSLDIVVLERGREVSRHRWPSNVWLGRFAALSADHRFAILSNHTTSRYRLVRVETGAVIAERAGNRNGDVSMQFSPGGPHVTLRRGPVVEILDLSAETSTGVYNIARGWGGDVVVRASKRGRSGEVQYLVRSRSLLAFDPVTPPTMLGLWPDGIFRRLAFTAAPGARDCGRTGDFGREGLVSPSERWLFATRHMRPNGMLSTVIDVYDLVHRRYVRSFAIPGAVGAMALSRDEGRLAVAVPPSGELQVYDLSRTTARPAVLIQVEQARTASLGFTDEGDLIHMSDVSENGREFRLPRPNTTHSDAPHIFITLER